MNAKISTSNQRQFVKRLKLRSMIYLQPWIVVSVIKELNTFTLLDFFPILKKEIVQLTGQC